MTLGEIIELESSQDDRYLVGNPSVSYFKKLYKRHTNFAMSTKKFKFDNIEPKFGQTFTCTIQQNNSSNINGDLLKDLFLCIELPELTKKFLNEPPENSDNKPLEGYKLEHPRGNGNTLTNDQYLNKQYLNQNSIISWVNSIGHAIIDKVEILFGDIPIDSHTGTWLEIWNEIKGGNKEINEIMLGKYEEWYTKGIFENSGAKKSNNSTSILVL